MKFIDLLTMSFGNLVRRKMRTALTILGVIIGTASVVIMLSIGIGMKEMTDKMYEGEGSLTQIQVDPKDDVGGNGKSNANQQQYLKDEDIQQLKSLEHVQGISPVIETSVILLQGKWISFATLTGSDEEYMKNLKLKDGEIPKASDKELRAIYGDAVLESFNDAKTGKGFFDTGVKPDVDYSAPMFVIYDTDAYYASKTPNSANSTDAGAVGGAADAGGSTSASGGDSTQKPKPPKRYPIAKAGELKSEEDGVYGTYSYGVYVNIDQLKAELKKVFRGKAIPNQPTTKKGRPLNFWAYQHLIVNVDKMKNVAGVQKKMKDLGYNATSNVEWISSAKKQTQMIQMMLGGIGGVSLFVAAIGIANTMMMSIYERTKEIGIMKVLGCDMNKIRDMFLMESAMIGFAGGIIGIGISYGVSIILNHLGGAKMIMSMDGDISIIPLWLSGLSVVFAVIVGMLAGFFPSIRAMRLSPLAALRNE